MEPTDPRHGTEAGHEQHARDHEPACGPCHHAKLVATRRRAKRKTMGYKYTLPLGEANHRKLTALKAKGAAETHIAEWMGVSSSVVWRMFNGGPEQVVYARTWLRVAELRPPRIVTPVGVTRRIQALTWMGYTPRAIAEAAGCHADTVQDARDGAREFLAARVREGIADAFDRLHMRSASSDDRWEGAAQTRMRSLARQRGYLPPLAWVDVDDPDEAPDMGASSVSPADVDPVVVERILAGEWRLPATRAERLEVIRRAVAAGRSQNWVERQTNWNVNRILKEAS